MPMALLPAHCQPIASLSPAHPQELASCSQGIHHELFPLIDLMRRLDLVGSNVAFFYSSAQDMSRVCIHVYIDINDMLYIYIIYIYIYYVI